MSGFYVVFEIYGMTYGEYSETLMGIYDSADKMWLDLMDQGIVTKPNDRILIHNAGVQWQISDETHVKIQHLSELNTPIHTFSKEEDGTFA